MNGIGFTELSVVFNCLKALCISSGAFYKNIKSWLYPVITQNFSLVQCNAIDRFKGKSISVSGDAQYDSPGFSAKYCTYTIIESKTGLLLDFLLYKRDSTQVT